MSGLRKTVSEQDWVILIWDPDYNDTSPWNVRADDLASAIAQAKVDWRNCLREPDDPDADWGEPEVHKAFIGSWIGDRVL